MPMCLDMDSSTIRLEIKVSNIEHGINLEKVKDVCIASIESNCFRYKVAWWCGLHIQDLLS